MTRGERRVRPNRSGASPRVPSRWSARTANSVIVDALVKAIASIPASEVRGLSWSWGEFEPGAPKTHVEVTFNIALEGLRRMVVGYLLLMDEVPISERLEVSSRRADRIIWRVREQLADHPTIGLIDTPADDAPVSKVIAR